MMKASCLMVTRWRRPYVHHAIECFRRQTYEDRELVIVGDRLDDECLAEVEAFAREDPRIRFIPETAPTVLGELRNRSVEEALGDVLVQWDDDDLYHPTRVERQVEAVTTGSKPAGVLRDQLLLFESKRRLYWIRQPRLGCSNTLAIQKKYMQRYPRWRIREDWTVMERLAKRGRLRVIGGNSGALYLRRKHEDNTCSDAHFDKHLHISLPLAHLVRNRPAAAESIHHLRDYLGPHPLRLVDARGLGYSIRT